MDKFIVASLGIVIISAVISVYFFPVLPDAITSHWNSEGQPDGKLSKIWALLLVPIISLAFLALFIAIPRIDPKKKNIQEFRVYYNGFIVLFLGFLLYIHILTIFWNLSPFPFVQAIVPAFSILFYGIGILMQKAKRNWFIGIRTPWTLSSDSVWEKTNMMGGKFFRISAVIALAGMVIPPYAFLLIIVPVLISVVITVIFSYVQYRKEEIKRNNQKKK